jgi:hypothetical protein
MHLIVLSMLLLLFLERSGFKLELSQFVHKGNKKRVSFRINGDCRNSINRAIGTVPSVRRKLDFKYAKASNVPRLKGGVHLD